MSRVVFTKIDIGQIQKHLAQKICLFLIASPKNCHISAQENCQMTAVAARTQIVFLPIQITLMIEGFLVRLTTYRSN